MLNPLDFQVISAIFFPGNPDFLVFSKVSCSLPLLQNQWFTDRAALVEATKKRKAAFVLFNFTEEVFVISNCHAVIIPGTHNGGTSFGAINNPDGTIRWLAPMAQKGAYYLHLYNGSGWRASILKLGVSIGVKLGLHQQIYHQAFTIYTRESPLWITNLQGDIRDHYAVFTGTKGENRKAVIAVGNAKQVDCFIKLPLTPAAEKLIAQERQQLERAAQWVLPSWKIPTVLIMGNGEEGAPAPMLAVSNVKPASFSTSDELGPLHIQALAECYHSAVPKTFGQLPVWEEMQAELQTLQVTPDHTALNSEEVALVKRELTKLAAGFDPKEVLPMAMAHGDFTPWNMFLQHNKLGIYDWELSRELPLGYDAFHFVLQSQLLIRRSSAEQITIQLRELTHYAATWGCSVDDLQRSLSFFLLRHISYYLLRYLRQDVLHEQVHWQLKVWCEMLRDYEKPTSAPLQ